MKTNNKKGFEPEWWRGSLDTVYWDDNLGVLVEVYCYNGIHYKKYIKDGHLVDVPETYNVSIEA